MKAYIDEYTDKYAIRPHIRFNSEVRSRTWDEQATSGGWTSAGRR